MRRCRRRHSRRPATASAMVPCGAVRAELCEGDDQRSAQRARAAFRLSAARGRDWSLTLRTRLAWAHEFDGLPSATAQFQGLPTAAFTVFGAPLARDAALATLGAEVKIGQTSPCSASSTAPSPITRMSMAAAEPCGSLGQPQAAAFGTMVAGVSPQASAVTGRVATQTASAATAFRPAAERRPRSRAGRQRRRPRWRSLRRRSLASSSPAKPGIDVPGAGEDARDQAGTATPRTPAPRPSSTCTGAMTQGFATEAASSRGSATRSAPTGTRSNNRASPRLVQRSAQQEIIVS